MGKDLSAHPAPGGQPTEGRFARLTSNLLARKGHAEPSNAFNPFFGPIVPADRGGTGPAKSEEAPAWLSIVNERSLDAGYPANPSGNEVDRADAAPERDANAPAPASPAAGGRTDEPSVPRLRRDRVAPAGEQRPDQPAERRSILRKAPATTPDAAASAGGKIEPDGGFSGDYAPPSASAATVKVGDALRADKPPPSLRRPSPEPPGSAEAAEGRRSPHRPDAEPTRDDPAPMRPAQTDPADDLMRLAAAAVAAAASSAAAEALAGADPDREDDVAMIRRRANDPGLPRRAAVTFRMSTRDFLRMKLGSAELGISSQDILIEALGEYLDARGVEGLGDCQCLRRAADQYEAATQRNAGPAALE